MKKCGFSIAELLIVVAILGIMAAIVVPQFQSQSTCAKGAVAKDSVRILRAAIELYTAQHSGIPPGYENDDPQTAPTSAIFHDQLVLNRTYLARIPKNPFNNLRNIRMIGNNEAFPPDAVDGYAWIYQAATKTIRLNWPGSDSSGVRYFDY
ncbi:MAG: prepilin-type N-terminal cleavage/methylation domain-containing protein [Phycisphaerae bacterium]|nr:prepilin-type N-terminal cleavage/methylation domain-containing protein [Phycisphaerae bacterium]